MRTFHELVVVVLERRALLSHVCCSACTQLYGAALQWVVSRVSGWGYLAEPTGAHRLACVRVWFAAQP